MSTQKTVQAYIDAAKNRVTYILAGIIILSALADIADMVVFDDMDAAVSSTIVAIVKLGMGLLMLFDPKRSLMRTVGFYALTLGISRIIASLSMLGNSSNFIFVIGIVVVAMGVNLVYSGYSYLQDVSRGRFGLIFGSSVLAIIWTAMLVTSVTGAFGVETDTGSLIVNVVYLIQYLLILLIMDSDDFRFSSWNEKSVRKIGDIRVTHTTTPGTYIERQDAKIIKHMFDDRSSWSPLDDGGPVECERKIRMADDKITSVMIMQKWRGSDRIYITVVTDDDGTILQANRFSVTDVLADDADDERFMNVRLFSDGTMLSNLSVKPSEVVPA